MKLKSKILCTKLLDPQILNYIHKNGRLLHFLSKNDVEVFSNKDYERFYSFRNSTHIKNDDFYQSSFINSSFNCGITSYQIISIRNLCTSSSAYPNYRYREGFGNRIISEPSRKGKYAKKPRSKNELIKEGFFEIKTELKKWRNEMKEKFEADPIFIRPGDTDKFFNFKSEEDLKMWKVSCDKDHNEGYSYGSLSLSPTGHGLFSGEVNSSVPKDGTIKYSGYINMTSYPPRKSFQRETVLNWMVYTHLVMRIRGDGRNYLLTLNTSGEFDITWNDLYTYILFTRGGPYWQNVKIPFSKFLFNAKGRVQDKQFEVPLNRVKTLGITASGLYTSPFRLEIDYIGVHCDPSHTEKFAYEMYKTPNYLT